MAIGDSARFGMASDRPEPAGPVLLSVIIPVYNEAHRLPRTLERVTAYLSIQPYRWELLVVDDGSHDHTALVAHAFAEQWPPMRVLTCDQNRGKGAAVRRGVSAARGMYMVFLDADLATPIEEIARFLPLLEGSYDVVLGSRAAADARILAPQPLHRRMMGLVFRRLVAALALPTVRDSQCGFKAFRTTAARHIFAQLTVDRFAFDVEVILLAQKLGYRVREVGVTWSHVPGTTVTSLRDALVMFCALITMRRRVQERLDDGVATLPGAHEPAIALVTLQSIGEGDDLAVEAARRAAEATVVAAPPGMVRLVLFGVTPHEATGAARRLAGVALDTAAQHGRGSAVSVDVQPAPLALPVDALDAAAHRSDGTTERTRESLIGRLVRLDQRRADELQAVEIQRAVWSRRRRTVRLLIGANMLGLVWWLDWLFNPSNAATGLLYALLVLAECFNVVQVLGYWYTVWNERAPERRRARVAGHVDVFVTTYNEPVALVEETVRAAVAMPYPHRTYVLDDGRRPEMGAMAARLGARWITRPNNRGAKAGNINHALSCTDGAFVVVFDADHVPHPRFLDRLMPYMAESNVAFVQAPQYYANRHKNFLAGGAMDQQELFFGPICKGKDGLDAVFCCGTNMVLRRAAIEDVGGFQENSITEDAVTSLLMHERGWTSRYVGERLADGLAPEDLGAYVSQQRRWARGNIEMLLRVGVLRRRMPWRLRFQYAWSAMYYLTSLTTVLYIVLPCLFLLFGIQTVSARSTDFIAHFLPYIFTTVLILARSAEGRLRFRAIQLSYGLFPVFIGALYSVVSNRKVGFAVTPKEGRAQSFYHLVTGQLIAVGVSLLAILVGFAHYAGPATVTNACWALFNVALLAAIIRAAAPQRAARVARPDADGGDLASPDTEPLLA